MKKNLLSAILLVVCGYSYSQNFQVQTLNEQKLVELKQGFEPKAYGDIIWQEDFNGAKWSSTVVQDSLGYLLDPTATLPEGWDFVDSLNMNYYWHWSDVGIRGASCIGEDDDCHTPDSVVISRLPEGTSVDNGFMLFEADYFNTTEDCELVTDIQEHHSYFEYGPIDFSDYPGVIFNCKNYNYFCCNADSRLVIQFCTDYNPETGEGLWSEEYKFNAETPIASYTYVSERDRHINVSASVAGNSNVYFRISLIDASHYFNIIDDIKFYEQPTYDLQMEDAWADYMYDAEDTAYSVWSASKYNFYGGYTQIPRNLLAPFVKFRGAVANFGTSEAVNSKLNVKIYKNDILDYSASTDPINIPSGEKDTLRLFADYTPLGVGDYQVSMSVTQDAADEVSENNNWGYNFEVVSNVYSRVYHGNEENFESAGPRDCAYGGFDGDRLAQLYDIPDGLSASLNSISVYIPNYDGLDDEIAAIENGEFAMIGRVYYDDPTSGETVDAEIATDIYVLQINDTATWLSLNFIDEGNLTLEGGPQKQYYMAIETFTETVQELRFEVGTDPTLKQPYGNGGLVYLSSQGGWYATGDNYAIDMILDISTPPILTFNYDVSCPGLITSWFNPETDTLFVTGSFNGWDEPGTGESIILTDSDNDLIYTGHYFAYQPQNIEYKYFSGSGSDGGEWEGDLNRSVEIAEISVTVNDTTPQCEVGFTFDPFENISIYPNPFTNELNISGLDNVETVIISNVIGQTIITIPAKNASVISTSELSKGIYILTFIDGDDNSRTERIVKE
ncbi:MAG: T9SS type A sorting domain-containing protein [Salinivirgaceae bacterium]|nr:T9SS type A sorting domain-containing protein [Salinivirgaceae bacterium]